MNISEMLNKPNSEVSAIAIRKNIEQVESALTEFDKISEGLAELAKRYPVDLVYDVTTTKGMAEAVAHRAAWREPRVLVEKYRKTAKAPVLALGKDIDARAVWITEQLLVGETPVHKQIKAEEDRKEAEKQARINAEAGRVLDIQEAISEIHMEVMALNGKPSAVIAAKLEEVKTRALDPRVFQEMLDQAKATQTAAIGKLEQMLKAQLYSEAEAAKLAAERTELAELRTAQAEQKRKDDAAAAQARKAEDARLAAEREMHATQMAAQRAEQNRLDAEAAAARAEADRIAREQREAEQIRIDTELAELRRQQDAADAERRAIQLKTGAAERRLRDAAPFMLAALRELRPLVNNKHLHIIDTAIQAATGQQ